MQSTARGAEGESELGDGSRRLCQSLDVDRFSVVDEVTTSSRWLSSISTVGWCWTRSCELVGVAEMLESNFAVLPLASQWTRVEFLFLDIVCEGKCVREPVPTPALEIYDTFIIRLWEIFAIRLQMHLIAQSSLSWTTNRETENTNHDIFSIRSLEFFMRVDYQWTRMNKNLKFNLSWASIAEMQSKI